MDIAVTKMGDFARIKLSGHVDERGAEEIKSSLDDLDYHGMKELVFDFSDVSRIGSAGIGQLLMVYKNLAAKGGRLKVENLSTTLLELFQGLKLDSLFMVSR